MDRLGSGSLSTAAMHHSAPGAPAVAEFAVLALSSKRPRIAERKTVLKQVAAMAVLHVIMLLVDILRVARAAEILEELFEHRDPIMAVGDDGAGH